MDITDTMDITVVGITVHIITVAITIHTITEIIPMMVRNM